MAGYTDMHNSVLKAKATASGKKEDADVAKKAEELAKKDEASKTSPVAAKKQEEQTKKTTEEKPVEEKKSYIENTNQAVANAKIGDWLKRNDGTEVQITQEDIDAAKTKDSLPSAPAKEEPKVEETKPEPKAEVEMSEDTKEVTKEVANNFGVPFGPEVTEEEMNAYGASDEARETKEELVGQVTRDGQPLSEEEFMSIFPSERPEDSLHWTQQLAPLLTVLSVVATAVGMANGVMIPPVNFNKLTNRDEAYQAYSDIMVADQNQKNADTNTIASPMQAYETEKAFDEKYGEGAYKKGAETFGTATEAGGVALQGQAHEQEKEKMGLEQKYNLETLDEQQKNELERLDKTGELDIRLKEVDQRFALENMNEANRLQLAIMEAQAEDNAEMAQLMSDLEANLDARSIDALQKAGLSVNDYARWMKGRGGRTAADTVKDFIDSGANIAGTAVDAVKPF